MSTRNIRIATFNVENLFTRFDFSAFSDERGVNYLPPVVRFLGDFGDGDLSKFGDFKQLMETAAVAQYDDHRQHTALAMRALEADLICLQEVDNLDALGRFLEAYLKKAGGRDFPYRVLQDGNDMRGIDVAAIARDFLGIYAKSHATLTEGDLIGASGKYKCRELVERYPAALEKTDHSSGRIFRRDCLELEIEKAGWDERISVFNCHFKSMGGRSKNKIGMRQLEACAVRAIIERKFDDPENALWLVTGDLNSYRGRIKAQQGEPPELDETATDGQSERRGETVSGADPLLDDGFGIDVLQRLPLQDRWTHYYAAAGHKTGLDWMIASPRLARHVVGTPNIIREGLPYRVPDTDGIKRYPCVGWDRPKASDHCPVVVEFSPTPQDAPTG